MSATRLTVLVASRGLTWPEDEGGDLRQLTAGLLRPLGDAGQGVRVLGTDLVRVYQPSLASCGVLFEDIGPVGSWLGEEVDVVYLQYGFSASHLGFAMAVKALGIPLVVSPESVLSDDFTQASWYSGRGRMAVLGKRASVPALRRAWQRLADMIVCADEHEVEASHLPADRTALVPLPVPHSPLATAAMARPPSGGDEAGPLAFIGRIEWRKGIDRVLRWADAYAEELPRPALRLLAGHADIVPTGLPHLLREGVVEWMPDARGADLLPVLEECRGVVLLSRWDGHPRALREASLLGLPVMATANATFGDTMAALDLGMIVDGDDPADIHDAFLAMKGSAEQGRQARQLLAPGRIGAFVLEMLEAVSRGQRPPERSYYRWEPDHHRIGGGRPGQNGINP